MRVLHHNQCFDGACSAALFSRFHSQCIDPDATYEFCGLSHNAPGPVPESVFGPGENAIVDFKYSSSPRLTWWFDHHESAFPTPADRVHFLEAQAGPAADRQFFDPQAISCTGFIARVAADRFGFDISGLAELLHWADIIDGARFESAKQAVEVREPALRLAMVIENAAESGDIPRIIPLLTSVPFSEIVALPWIAERIEPLLARQRAAERLIAERACLDRGVIFFSLLDRVTETLSKFIPYYLFPEATYTIAVTRSSARIKISVGTNPWTALPPGQLVNIAEICSRFGGGGHARVGAISLPTGETDRASAIAETITSELRNPGGQR